MSKYSCKRRNQRKEELVKMKGGKCKICGYSKSLSALTFHHKNIEQKRFTISGNKLLKRWDELLKEIEKCDLLCMNCHAEVHDEEGWPHENGKRTPKHKYL